LDRYPGLSIEAIGQNADVAIVLGGDAPCSAWRANWRRFMCR